MCNPSTADETVEDATIRKCIKFSRRWGHGAITVVNVFAWRSTDPQALYEVDDPIGPDNDATILREVRSAGVVVCAWGKHAALRDRGREVLAGLRVAGVVPKALKLNKDGSPQHPLYIRDDTVPFVIA